MSNVKSGHTGLKSAAWTRSWSPAAIFVGVLVLAISGVVVVANNHTGASNNRAAVPARAVLGLYSSYEVRDPSQPRAAPQPPRTEATHYCDSSSAHRLAVDQVRQALTLEQSFLVRSGNSGVQPKSVVSAELRQAVNARVPKFFTGTLAAEKTRLYTESVSNLDPATTRQLGGGVSQFTCREALDSNTGATMITAKAEMWVVYQDRQDDGSLAYSNPHNEMLVSAAVDASGKIVQLTTDFAAGSRP